MSDTAFVLIAHGAREASWALPLRRVADSVVAQAPELRVELAFMELMPPDLGECAEKLVAEGFRRIMVVPLFIARGGHLMRDVPEQLAALHQNYPAVTFDELIARTDITREQTGLNLTAMLHRLRDEGCLIRDRLLF